jgi:hypothetical protein
MRSARSQISGASHLAYLFRIEALNRIGEVARKLRCLASVVSMVPGVLMFRMAISDGALDQCACR